MSEKDSVGCSVKGKMFFFFKFFYNFSFHSFLVFFSSINVNCFRRKIKSFCVVKVHRGVLEWDFGELDIGKAVVVFIFETCVTWCLVSLCKFWIALDIHSTQLCVLWLQSNSREENVSPYLLCNKKALLNHESLVYLWSHYSNVYKFKP